MASGKKKHALETPTIENRKARFDYEITDTLECGIMLAGSEVKAVREGKMSINEGWVRAQSEGTPGGPGLYLQNVNIGQYGPAAHNQPPALRVRKLLAHKKEIAKFAKAVEVKGASLVPLKVYFKNGFAKCLIGLGTGRKRHDKRDTIKQREMKRDADRAMGRRDR
jgi:SsrA-binding protein